MPIESLALRGGTFSDLSPLAGLPLKQLYLDGCPNVTDVGSLAKITTLEKVTVPVQARNIEALQKLHTLQMLAFQVTSKSPWIPTSTADDFWKAWPRMAWMRTLSQAGMKYTANQDAEGFWKVTVTSPEFSDCSIFKSANVRELNLTGTSVADIGPLKELTLTKLNVTGTGVTDLSPLRAPALSANLKDLRIVRCNVTDFSPLAACTSLEILHASYTTLADLAIVRGRKLRELHLRDTKVADISVLAGMPLTFLVLNGTAVTDLRPLLRCPDLQRLVLPEGARDVAALGALTGLAEISFASISPGGFPAQKATEFWKDYQQFEWARTLGKSGFTLAEFQRLPGDTRMALKIASLLVWFGHDSQYTDTCRRMIEWAGNSSEASNAERVAKLSVLHPTGDATILPAALGLARRAVDLGKELPETLPWYQMALGMVQYRSGNYPEAASVLASAAGTASNTKVATQRAQIEGTASFYRAMCLFQQGKPDDARNLITATEAKMKPFPADHQNPLAENYTDFNDLILWLACKEAKALLAQPGPPAK